MKVPVPQDLFEDASSKHNDAWKIFYVHQLYTDAPQYECVSAYTFDFEHSYSVVQTYDPSLAWNQYLLLQEQKQSGVKEKSNVTVWRTSL